MLTVETAREYLEAQGYRVTKSRILKNVSKSLKRLKDFDERSVPPLFDEKGYIPWVDQGIGQYKSQYKNAPMIKATYIFADNIVVHGYIVQTGGKWRIRSGIQAACDRYRYRKAWEFTEDGKGNFDDLIDSFPVPELIAIHSDLLYDMEEVNRRTEEYRKASGNRFAGWRDK